MPIFTITKEARNIGFRRVVKLESPDQGLICEFGIVSLKETIQNRKMRFSLVLIILVFTPSIHAHIVGDQEWCIQSSAEHMVCEFHDLKECEDTLKKSSKLPSFFAPTTETAERLPASCVINQKILPKSL